MSSLVILLTLAQKYAIISLAVVRTVNVKLWASSSVDRAAVS